MSFPLVDQAVEHQDNLELWLSSLNRDELNTLADEVNQFTNRLMKLAEKWPTFSQYLLLLIHLDSLQRELRELRSRD